MINKVNGNWWRVGITGRVSGQMEFRRARGCLHPGGADGIASVSGGFDPATVIPTKPVPRSCDETMALQRDPDASKEISTSVKQTRVFWCIIAVVH